MQPTSVLHKNETIQYQVIEQQAVLVMPEEGQIKVLNAVGAFIWENIEGTRSLADIVELVVQNFDVDPEQASRDLFQFTTELHHKNMIRES